MAVSFYQRFKKYITNTSWLLSDKIISLGITFAVTVIVTRYLGPEQFGMLSYAISLTALFASASHMGLGGLVVREIVKNREERPLILGTSFALKMSGSVLGYALLMIYAYKSEGWLTENFYLILFVSTSMLVLPLTGIISFWFESQVQGKYSSIAQLSGIISGSILKVLFVVLGAGLTYFAFAHVLQSVMVSIFLLVLFQKKSGFSIVKWKFSLSKAKELLSSGWVIFLGSIFAVIYLKIDQVMLRWLVDDKAVGVYSVAATMSEVWYFIPTAIVASLYPRLIELSKNDSWLYRKRLQQIFDILFFVALIVAIAVNIFAPYIISLFFGDAYHDAAGILIIHIWAALFVFMRAALSKWILVEDLLVFSMITQGFGALVNVILNFYFIPLYGGQGAAIATLISYATASYFSLLVTAKSREVFVMMSLAIFLPLRLPYNYFIRNK
ncbi:MAG: flippase [Chlorobium sp.]|uniref:flippase n=1 Tax=Chlorobium sp. TaxID=1095 RepID=UPI002F408F68